MKRFPVFSLWAFLVLAININSFAQTSCDFSIVGTWQSTTGGHVNPTLLRFAPNGTATVLSHNNSGHGSEWQSAESSRYKLDNPKAPTALHLAPKSNPEQVTSLKITKFDDGGFTTEVDVSDDGERTNWTRVDGQRYFIVMASGKGSPGYGDAAFAMLIKSDGNHTQTDSFGLWPVRTNGVNTTMQGPMPEEILKKFDNEPRDDSAAMLRLEVTAGPYDRALRILKVWERRRRENTMLYDIPYLDNAVYLNQLASSLNDCSETIKLEKLTWRIDDDILMHQNLPQVPYFFIKRLRHLNDALHVRDNKFHESRQAMNLPPAR
jgi:hypothetical protein